MKLFLVIMTMLLQAPAPPRSGGVVTGTVNIAGTSEPVPDAEIAISTAAALLETTTDSNGRFSLGNVPAGAHTVLIRADGFFAVPAVASAAPQARAEVPVSVAIGASATVPPVTMIRGAIIAGKVVDPQGKALPFATVLALRQGAAGSLQGVATRTTDDQGEYRLFWVPPGEYVIAVNPRPIFPTNPAQAAAGSAQIRPVIRTLFPGTTDIAQAGKVAVNAGDEIRGIDVSARLDPVDLPSPSSGPNPAGVKISGQITNKLAPANGPGTLLLGTEADPGQPRPVGSVPLSEPTVPFEIPSVPPGKYDLFVRVNDIRGSLGAGGAQNAWGRATVEVRDRDVDGVQMILHASVDVPGVLKVDGKPVSAGGGLKVGLSPMGTAGRIPNYRGILDRAQTPGDEGKFAIPGAAEGNYDVFVQGGDANSYLADIRQRDTSILATGVAVHETVPAVVEVLFATDGGIVEGIISSSDKSPVGGAAVVLVPEDLQLIRLSKNVTAGPDGKYLIRGVRPGEYKVFAGTPGSAPSEKGVKVTVKAASTAKADAGLITD